MYGPFSKTRGINQHEMSTLTILILFTAVITHIGANQVIRQNIGLIYEQLPGQIITGHDEHQIILAVPYTLPQIPHAKPPIYETIRKLQLPGLGPRDNYDTQMLQQAADLDQLIINVDKNILMTMKNIQLFLSNPVNNRPKRALLGFLGELFKSIFGLATTRDMDSIINTIRHMDTKLGTLADTNVKTAKGLKQVSQQHQNFLDTYVKQQDTIEEALLNITNSIDSWSDDFSTTLSSLERDQDKRAAQTAIVSAQTAILLTRIAYQQGLSKIENSLRLLSTGILAPDMVKPAELAEKLKQLDTQMKLTSLGSKVTIMNVAYYYTQQVALYTYTKTHLYIHIKVIISSTDAAFDLYQIINMDIPIDTENTNSTGTTTMISQATFLAVNKAETLFLEMTTHDLVACAGRILRICSRTMPRIRANRPTCHIAVFKNNQEQIAKLCTFNIQPKKIIETRAIAIDKDKYLVTTSLETYRVICNNAAPEPKKALAYAIVGVPCLCHLEFGGTYLPNTRLPCNNSESTFFTMHTANIPILTALADHHDGISPSSFHDKPIRLSHLHTEAMIRALSQMKKLPKSVTMDLVPFTDMILEDAKKAATDIHRPLRNAQVTNGLSTFLDSPAWNYIIALWMIVITALITLILYKIIGGPALFTAIPRVTALPHNITWKHILKLDTEETNSRPNVHIDQYIDSENIFTIITVALIIYAVIKILQKVKGRCTKHFGLTNTTSKTNPTITLKVYNGYNNHTIPLLSLPYEWDVIDTNEVPTLTEIESMTCPHPRVNMTWSGPLSFNIEGQIKTFYLPNHALLPFRARFTIIKALRDDSTTTALILKSTSRLISLTPTQCNKPTDIIGNLEYEQLIKHPKDMTAKELLEAMNKPTTEVGFES